MTNEISINYCMQTHKTHWSVQLIPKCPQQDTQRPTSKYVSWKAQRLKQLPLDDRGSNPSQDLFDSSCKSIFIPTCPQQDIHQEFNVTSTELHWHCSFESGGKEQGDIYNVQTKIENHWTKSKRNTGSTWHRDTWHTGKKWNTGNTGNTGGTEKPKVQNNTNDSDGQKSNHETKVSVRLDWY